MKNKLAELFRFARVSLLATIVDFGVGYVLTQTELTDIVIATVLGSIGGIVVGFILNKYWVFQDKSNDQTNLQFMRYVAVSLGNTVLNAVGVWSLEQAGLTNYWLIRVIAGTTVFIFYSYLITKAFVFARSNAQSVL